MTRFLYLHLASQNIRRNGETWRPFLLASSLLTFALYSLAMLKAAPMLDPAMGMSANMIMSLIFSLGLVVVGVFTLVFLIYADAFLLKRRKKEIGLYGVLGMERRHIMRVQLYELLIAYLITMLIGLGLGMLLARLMFLVLRALTGLPIAVTGAPSVPAILLVAALTGAMFLGLLARHSAAVVRIRPVDLLHAPQQSEREPRANWLLAILGVVCMLAGYGIALRVKEPVSAITFFFFAGLLVIVGTYLVFITTSVALLRLLKGNKRFYYQPRHMITVSGMLYRMKANASGLASIAILSTMAMVTIGTTSSLYLGTERIISRMYPYDFSISTRTVEERDLAKERIFAWAEENGVAIGDTLCIRSRQSPVRVTEGHTRFEPGSALVGSVTESELYMVTAVPAADFTNATGTALDLAPDEAAWYGSPMGNTLRVGGSSWRVRLIDRPAAPLDDGKSDYLIGQGVLVLPEWDDVITFARATPGRYEDPEELELDCFFRLNWLTGSRAERAQWERDAEVAALHADQGEAIPAFTVSMRDDAAIEFYSTYGSLVFVGLFLGIIFLMGTLLIIYFKQLSEGYQDHDRFIILQKVGMSQQEVRHTVRQQILLVFMAPLAVALCHVAGSLKMIALMLRMFGLSDVPFIAVCSLGSAVIVAAAYALFYSRTARTYYRLVRFDGMDAMGGRREQRA